MATLPVQPRPTPPSPTVAECNPTRNQKTPRNPAEYWIQLNSVEKFSEFFKILVGFWLWAFVVGIAVCCWRLLLVFVVGVGGGELGLRTWCRASRRSWMRVWLGARISRTYADYLHLGGFPGRRGRARTSGGFPDLGGFPGLRGISRTLDWERGRELGWDFPDLRGLPALRGISPDVGGFPRT